MFDTKKQHPAGAVYEVAQLVNSREAARRGHHAQASYDKKRIRIELEVSGGDVRPIAAMY
jgi:hypothetical protein